MTELWREFLQHVSGSLSFENRILCLFLTHNEAPLLPDLFAHYRAMGDMQFVVVNDRSTDATPDILSRAPDVTVFTPKEGSTYAKDKRAWRGTLLDAFGAGRWCLVIDVDERLVWRGYPDRSLADLIGDLEARSAQALIASMVDMYADKPLADHVADDRPLRDQFPFFDDPRKDPSGYRAMLMPSKFRKKFPFPNMKLIGGMRQRLFGQNSQSETPFANLFPKLDPGRHRHATGYRVTLEAMRRRLTKHPSKQLAPLNLTKVPLIKWRIGLRYSGGAHHINEVVPTVAEYGVLLHYAITKGLKGIAYNVDRGQHAEGGSYYLLMLAKGPGDLGSPTYQGSSRLESISDLDPFFGGTSR